MYFCDILLLLERHATYLAFFPPQQPSPSPLDLFIKSCERCLLLFCSSAHSITSRLSSLSILSAQAPPPGSFSGFKNLALHRVGVFFSHNKAAVGIVRLSLLLNKAGTALRHNLSHVTPHDTRKKRPTDLRVRVAWEKLLLRHKTEI